MLGHVEPEQGSLTTTSYVRQACHSQCRTRRESASSALLLSTPARKYRRDRGGTVDSKGLRWTPCRGSYNHRCKVRVSPRSVLLYTCQNGFPYVKMALVTSKWLSLRQNGFRYVKWLLLRQTGFRYVGSFSRVSPFRGLGRRKCRT